MIISNFPTFQTNRLILREVMEADSPSYEAHFIDYDVISQFARTVPWPYPKDKILEYIKHEIRSKQGVGKWTWGICLKNKPDELIGCVDLWRDGKPENRGFWLGRKFWGQGIMTEAVIPVMDYAFDILNFEKLIFTNAAGNSRSRRIKEKTGARFVCFESAEYVNPDYLQREVWELTKNEWYKTSIKRIDLKP